VPLLGAAPVALGVLTLLAVPESPRWLAGRTGRASGAAGAGGNPLREVFTPPLLRRTVLGILLGAIPVIGTSANGNWLVFWSDHAAGEAAKASAAPGVAQPGSTGAPSPRQRPPADPRNKALTQIQRSGGGLLGSLLGGWVASLLGRRLTYFLISLCSFALSTFIFGLLDPLNPRFGLFAFLLGFAGVTYFGWLPLYLPELFPTRVRSTGTGVSFNSGRVIAAVVVLGASGLIALSDGDFAKVGLWTGSIYAAGMLVICLAPARGGGKLED
jgi:hypothetical protein